MLTYLMASLLLIFAITKAQTCAWFTILISCNVAIRRVVWAIVKKNTRRLCLLLQKEPKLLKLDKRKRKNSNERANSSEEGKRGNNPDMGNEPSFEICIRYSLFYLYIRACGPKKAFLFPIFNLIAFLISDVWWVEMI